MPVQLLVANILALRLLAPSVARVASPRGTLILSGLLGTDVPGVLSAYAVHGWRLRRHDDREGWVALVLPRRTPFPLTRRCRRTDNARA